MATRGNSRQEIGIRATIWSPPVTDREIIEKINSNFANFAFRDHDGTKNSQQCKNRDRPTWGFGEFGKYMDEKTRKLREQFQSDATERLLQPSEDDGIIMPEGFSQIFQGVIIWVNGYTTPSHQELKHLMLAHGGTFENYMSAQVTHIICSHLPDGKYLDYRHKKSLPPILKPAWVTDSILAGELLPVDHYKLLRLAYDHPGQTTLEVAFKFPQLPLAQASLQGNTWKEQGQEQLKNSSHYGIESGGEDAEVKDIPDEMLRVWRLKGSGGVVCVGMNGDLEPATQARPNVCKMHCGTTLLVCENTVTGSNGDLSGKIKSWGAYERKQEKRSGLDVSRVKTVGESQSYLSPLVPSTHAEMDYSHRVARDVTCTSAFSAERAEPQKSFVSDEHAATDKDFLSTRVVDSAMAGVQHVADLDANSMEGKNVLNLKMGFEDKHQDLVLKTVVNISTEVVDSDGYNCDSGNYSILNVEETQLVGETDEEDPLMNGRGELGKQEKNEVSSSKVLSVRTHSTKGDQNSIQNYYKANLDADWMELEDEHQDLVLKTVVPVNSSTEVVDSDGDNCDSGNDSTLNVEETQLVGETDEEDPLGKQENNEVSSSKVLSVRTHSTKGDQNSIQNYYKANLDADSMELEDEHQDLVLKTVVPVNSSTEVVDSDGDNCDSGNDSTLNVEETQLVGETDEEDPLVNGRGELGKQESNEAFPSRVPSVRSHSTKGDPNFIQNYYKYSRLHFIGTWRNRYQAAPVPAGDYSAVDKPNLQAFLPSEQHKVASNKKNNIQARLLGLKRKNSAERWIIHIDMDCFFVSVVIRNRPELTNQPVAVCHSDSSRGTAEISSANYIARNFGVSAGMFMREAKRRCPNLMVVPYDFKAYEKVADQVYAILHRHSSSVQALSCDEAFLDVTGLGDPAAIARAIRREIAESTQCPASAGIAPNLLLARLATRKAKPNGQVQVLPEKVADFIADLPVADLHGVGNAHRKRLHSKGLKTCADLRKLSRGSLQREFGKKKGDMLWSYARGIDSRAVQPAQERKSIGAAINWGVRFSCEADAQKFLKGLVGEVCRRLSDAKVRGRIITLKAKKRKAGAPKKAAKFMGCGVCDNINRSQSLGASTDDPQLILQASKELYAGLGWDPTEVRGVGLQVSKLEPSVTTKFTSEKTRTSGSLAGMLPVCWLRRSGEPKENFEQAVLGDVNTVSKHEMKCRSADIECHEGENPAVTSSEGTCEPLKGKMGWLVKGMENQGTGHALAVKLAGNEYTYLQESMKDEEKVPVIVMNDSECKLKERQKENIGLKDKTEQKAVRRELKENDKGAEEESIDLEAKPVGNSFNVSHLTFDEAGPSKGPFCLKANSLLPVPRLDPTVLAALPEDILGELETAYALDKGHGHFSCKRTGALKHCEAEPFEVVGIMGGDNRLERKSSVIPEHLADQCEYEGDKGRDGVIVRNGALKVEDTHVFPRISSKKSKGLTGAETESNHRTEVEYRPPTSSLGVEALPPASQVFLKRGIALLLS